MKREEELKSNKGAKDEKLKENKKRVMTSRKTKMNNWVLVTKHKEIKSSSKILKKKIYQLSYTRRDAMENGEIDPIKRGREEKKER